MPCPHFSISICSRGSSVAGSAYQSGEKLYCVYDDDTKDYEYKSEEIVFKEVVLPENAPEEYSDRATLWNSVEKSRTELELAARKKDNNCTSKRVV